MPEHNTIEPYQQAMMLCGGGHQYARLLGHYQGVVERGRAPDLLVASCGGAIIANLICRLATVAERIAWLSSPQMYQFWCSQIAGPGNQLPAMLYAALNRKLAGKASNNKPDLFNTWLFDFTAPFPSLGDITSEAPDILIIGTQMRYLPSQVQHKAGSDALFNEAVFTTPRAAKCLQGQRAAMALHSTRIASELAIYTDTCALTAMRISVADCYYYAPLQFKDHFFCGGLINLFPMEIALACAKNVIALAKPAFDTLLAAPAIEHVFGFNAQQRLNQYHQCNQLDWLPEPATNEKTPASIQKRFNWKKRELTLNIGSYQQFKTNVYAQYQAGYQTVVSVK